MKRANVKLGITIDNDPDFYKKNFSHDDEIDGEISKLECLGLKGFQSVSLKNKLLKLWNQYPKSDIVKHYCLISVACAESSEHQLINYLEDCENVFYRVFAYLKVNVFNNLQAFWLEQISNKDMVIGVIQTNKNYCEKDLAMFLYYHLVCVAKVGDQKQFREIFDLLKDISPAFIDSDFGNKKLAELNSQLFSYSSAKDFYNKNIYTVKPTQLPMQVTEQPKFYNPEVKSLYSFDKDNYIKEIKKIRKWSKINLQSDLEAVLADSHNRFDVLIKNRRDNYPCSIAALSVFFLAEFSYESSLPKILDGINFEEGELTHFFSYAELEQMWWVFIKLGKNQLDLLQNTIMKPGYSGVIKKAIFKSFARLTDLCSDKRGQIIKIYEDYFDLLLNAKQEDNILDLDLLNDLVYDVAGYELTELIPKIQKLYDKGFIQSETNDIFESFDTLMKAEPYKKLTSLEFIFEETIELDSTYDDENYFDENDDHDEDANANVLNIDNDYKGSFKLIKNRM